jgi:hypothetical protein
MPFAFEKLLVYQKTVDFSDRICELSGKFPRGFYFLTDQINRAALSISTNIAEGNGRFTMPDKRNFFGIARGSVQECVPLPFGQGREEGGVAAIPQSTPPILNITYNFSDDEVYAIITVRFRRQE